MYNYCVYSIKIVSKDTVEYIELHIDWYAVPTKINGFFLPTGRFVDLKIKFKYILIF